MIALLLVPALIIVIFLIGGYVVSAPAYRGPESDHFDGKKFINPGNVKAQGLITVLKWLRERKRGEWTRSSCEPGAKPDDAVSDGVKITFINHTTFLIQADGINILTDPVYSERVSPFSFAGPKRMRPPGIRFEDLPAIDIVLLSHNHYDHLDIDTVKRLNTKCNPLFIVPLGVAAFLRQSGIEKVHELDWWQAHEDTTTHIITAVPAQHFSGRGFFDRDRTLWCGYVIKTKHASLCFVGDTGYNGNTFKEISKHFGGVNLAIIPIGAYKPEWFMSPIHCSPEEAVKIHIDLKSELSIASHFGTFPLGDDGQHEPAHELDVARKKLNVPVEKFITLKEGTAIKW